MTFMDAYDGLGAGVSEDSEMPQMLPLVLVRI